MHVTGIGQCSLDYLAVVDRYPSPDTKLEALTWEEQGGGPVATALVTLRRLGAGASLYGVVGDDGAGESIRRSLLDENVDISGLVTRGRSASQKAFILIEKGSGRRTIIWKRPTGQPLAPAELGRGFLGGTDFLLLDGLMAEASIHAAREAKRMGIPVMLDAGRVREGMLELARLSDYVVASEEFARDMELPDFSEDEARFLRLARGILPGIFTVTYGHRGSVTLIGEKVVHQTAFEVQAVDTTGAGDVFHGGYAFGLLKGWSLVDTLRFASALAAMKCMRVGGRAGIPSLDAVLEFLGRQSGSPYPGKYHKGMD
jgi:ribokinase